MRCRFALTACLVAVALAGAGILQAEKNLEDELNRYLSRHREMGAVDWQKSGKWILFSRGGPSAGNTIIYKIEADGKNLTRLTFTGDDAGAIWSPDGRSIAFASARRGGDFFRMTAGGADEVSLGKHPAASHLCAWSPDGSQIAFVTHRGGGPYIALMTADRGKEIRFAAAGSEADWHPSGDYLVVEAGSSEKVPGSDGTFAHLYEVNVKTRQRRQITSGPFSDREPRYSPDGEWIVFVSDGRRRTANAAASLCLVRRDGTGLTVVPTQDSADWEYGSPDFSADGKRLVFAGGRLLPTDLYTCRLDGADRKRLTRYYP